MNILRSKMFSLCSVLLISAVVITGCGSDKQSTSQAGAAEVKTYKWKMVTSWPKNFPGLGTAPETFSKYVEKMSAGRLTVKVFGAGELVPGLEVFDTVSQGTVEMGHSGAYYWKGKIPAAQMFSTIPFGMTATEMNAWLHFGGGLELWEELYKPFGLIPMAGGNSGGQFAGWFKKEINSVDDLKGLKMRMPGLGGEVLKRAGGIPINLAGGEIFSSLQSGALDASEWVGPYNDLAFGFYQVADYYYSSIWHETGTTLEFMINEKAFNELPSDLQEIVRIAAKAVNQDMLDEYTARNSNALKVLVDEHNVKLKQFPDDVLLALKKHTKDVLADEAKKDKDFARVLESYQDFLSKARDYNDLTLKEYLQHR
ncbi:TRAP transporter substrate-binding protein [Colwellia sp. RE-S-Sl-9]